jgi:hypothetical protein
MDKRTNNDLQNTTQKTKDRATLEIKKKPVYSLWVSLLNKLGCQLDIRAYNSNLHQIMCSAAISVNIF